MQIYSTRFRTSESFTPELFVENLLEWNRKRQHPAEDIVTTDLSFITGDDDNYIEVTNIAEKNLIAARVHEETNGGIWNIDFVLNYSEHVISARVDRSFSEKTINLSSRAFMPTFITQIITKGFAGLSSGIKIDKTPYIVSDQNTLENIMNANDEYALPVVWLTPAARIKADIIASKLTGLAVVISDSDGLVTDNIPSPVFVYFPNGNMDTVTFGDYPFHRDIQTAVNYFHNNREYSETETWNGVQNILINLSHSDLLSKYRSINADNDTLTEMYSDLEEEIKNGNKQREELYAENSRLVAENAKLMHEIARLSDNGMPALMQGQENEMYPDEQREILIYLLKECMKNSVSLQEGTRRYDIVKSIVDANPVKDIPQKYQKIIKEAFDGYTTFETSKIKKALKDTGIEIVEHTGHYKIALNGDSRYVCTAAATCSDSGRGGKNLISEIINIMF